MPVNYAAYQNANNPLQMAMQGFSDGSGIRQAQEQRQQQQQIGQQTIDLNQQKIEAYKQAQGKQQAFQGAISGLGSNPSPQALQKVMMAYPQLGVALREPFDILNAEQKQNKIMDATQVSSALSSGGVDAAIRLVDTQIRAAENGGDPAGAASLRVLKQQIEMNPDSAALTVDMFLNANMGPEQYASFYEKRTKNARENALQPLLKDKATSEAATAAIEAKFAESLAASEAAAKGFDISSLISDPSIAKQNKKIANMVNLRDKAASEMGRTKLQGEIDDAQIKRDDATLAKANEIGTAQLNVDTMMLTIEELEALGEEPITTMGIEFQSVRDAATGTLEGTDAWYNPTWNQPVADYQEALNTFKSQIFLTQIPKMKGLGALTGPEGARLETAIKSVSLRQSSERLKGNIATIKDLTTKAQEFLRDKYGDLSASVTAAKKRGTGRGATASGGFSVTAPNGKTYPFKTQADADAFRAKIGG